MQQPPRILFLADGGPEVGGGHLMRCLTLAGALVQRGAACAVADHPGAAAVLDAFAGLEIERLPASSLAEAARLADGWGARAVVLDGYRLGRAEEGPLRGPGRRLMVIDDLADRPHDCDLLLDASLGRREEDYARLIPSGARVLAGPSYALVRPAFAGLRDQTLARRRQDEPPQRLVVSLGLTDLDGITGRVVQALQPALEGMEADVVVGAGAPSLELLTQLAEHDIRLRVHVEAQDMPRLLADADLAVGAGGSSTWERACLGLPTLALVLADNQREMARRLTGQGAQVTLESRDPGLGLALAESLMRLRTDRELRRGLSEASAALCDGEGAARAAEALLAVL